MAAHPQQHQSGPAILDRRTLDRDHRHLAKILRPGLSVLDVGCGTGAITAGIAKAVGPDGSVIGLDRDAGLLEIARRQHCDLSNLRFDSGDAVTMNFDAQFDIVTSARTLQWIAEPDLAVAQMKKASRPSGLIVVLDYNHAHNKWEPEPPAEFMRFYQAFLNWRKSNGWDNRMADRLPDLFRSAGLLNLQSHNQDELTERGDADFNERTALWGDVIVTLGERLTVAGFLTPGQVSDANECYVPWARTKLRRQLLELRAVTGQLP